MCRILLFLLLLPVSLLLSSEVELEKELYTKGPIPSWVKECDYSLDKSHNPAQVNLQYLLTDFQRSWPDQTSYYHSVIKPLTSLGVSYAAQIEIDFSPSFQKVVVHHIRVYRNGEWSDRLEDARYSLLQREEDLEFDLYNGEFTLVYFLEDVCEGDIVEYAFSLVGEIPYFSSHLINMFHFQDMLSFDHLYRRLIASPDIPVNYKLFNNAIEPQITDISPTLREWSWELENTEIFAFETDLPVWYDPIPSVQFSQYANWKEVIEKMVPIYTLPEDFDSNPSQEMVDQVNLWMHVATTPMQRAFLALRFVQEKVRYLGFEEGMDGFKPRDPRSVFLRKYGDCKDKTFLLHALLKMMDISSTPVLVNSMEGKNLPDYLPLPLCFDHIVLRIEMDGDEYWVDSTIQHQGGSSLKENFMPIYHWGLPLSLKDSTLVRMDGNYVQKATLINTLFTLQSEDKVELTIDYTFFGHKADYMRRYLETRGAHGYTDDALSALKRLYGQATSPGPIDVVDDRENNVIKTTEKYIIPTQKNRGKKMIKVYSSTIRNYLDCGFNPDRVAPYALYYPVWVKEHIHIDNALADWKVRSDEMNFEHDSFVFNHAYDIGGTECDLYYELHHLKDHVPQESLREYWEMTEEIDESRAFQICVLTDKKDAA